MKGNDHPRRPAGSPSGGQYTARPLDETDVELDAPREHFAEAPVTSQSSSTAWPSLGFEQRDWVTRDGISRSAARQHRGPYPAAVVPQISNLSPVLPADVMAEESEATAAISRFDEYVTSILGSGAEGEPVELGPMASILLRSESSSSSQIENLTVGAKQLALAELAQDEAGDGTGDPVSSSSNARLVARNVTAVQAALAASQHLDVNALLDMHAALLAESDPRNAGRIRDQQVWVGGSGAGPHQAAFIPPHHERVEAALFDLMAFCDRDDLPPLTQAAIAHAQFETIHPFTDGNGRTGRALVHAMLRSKGVTRRVTVPVSAGLLASTQDYFDALSAYRLGDPRPIVGQFSGAALAAIANGHQLLDDVSAAKARWTSALTARRDAAAWRLSDQLVAHPVVNAASVSRQLGVSWPAADNAIAQLAAVGALTQLSAGRRNKVWQAPDIIASLDAFASRAGRRSW